MLTSHRPVYRHVLFGALQLMSWGLYAVLFYFAVYPYYPFVDIAFKRAVVAAGSGVLLTTLLRFALHYLRLQQLRLPVQAAVALVLVALVTPVWETISNGLGEWLDPFVNFFAPALAPVVRLEAYGGVLLLWTVCYFGLTHWRNQQAQATRLLKVDALAHQARLQMLRYQLNPHFLFNALTSISALADENPARIKQMVQELSGFLRYSLLDPERMETPLRDEVQAVAHYLRIEQIRFEDDLEVALEVAPEAASYPVPAFLLLPLVENAIKYGQQTSPTPLRIRLSAHRTAEGLHLAVANTGTWVAEADRSQSTGTGLRNVRERLAEAYPNRHHFAYHEAEGWVVWTIKIGEKA